MSRLLNTYLFLLITLLCISCGGAGDEEEGETPTPSPTATTTPEPSATTTPEPSATTTPQPSATTTPQPSATTTPTPSPTTTPQPGDSDGDGVGDAQDECPDTPQGQDVNDVGCLLVEVIGDCELSDAEYAMIVAHNEARSQDRWCGENFREAVPALRWDCRLAEAALLHSQDMAENDFFSHEGSDGSTPFERMRDAGYQYRAAGENIYAGSTNVSNPMTGWLDSEGHCRNIMSSNFEDMGAGLASDENSTYRHYWSAGFGTHF